MEYKVKNGKPQKGYIRSFSTNEEIYTRFSEIIKREGTTISDVMLDMMLKYIEQHDKSNNPQTTIAQFDRQEVRAVPNLYADISMWQKFYTLLDEKGYKEVDQKINEILHIHNQEYKS